MKYDKDTLIISNGKPLRHCGVYRIEGNNVTFGFSEKDMATSDVETIDGHVVTSQTETVPRSVVIDFADGVQYKSGFGWWTTYTVKTD